MDKENIKRVLVYTHNSIGLGHAFRTLAVITGIKKWRPDIDFLVVSGTSIPQVFFASGIEVIKLPSIKLDIDDAHGRMSSRYLTGCGLERIFDFRQRMILDSFDFFQPDALIVEHNMTGQMSELIPLLMKKWARKGGPGDFALVHVCRGIMRWIPLLNIPYQNPKHRSESINIGSLYDHMYVLEDREIIDINQQFLGNDPDLEPKIKYLGKITNRVHSELPPRSQVLDRFGLPEKPTILVSLGRNNKVLELTQSLLSKFNDMGLHERYQFVIIADPYLQSGHLQALKEIQRVNGARFIPFIPDLVDLIYHSELVVSRAGYNTVNEILLTGTKALLIPESHGGGEQELRVHSIHTDTIKTMSEDELLSDHAEVTINELLASEKSRAPQKFDKYAIGKVMIDDMENWVAASNRGRC